MFASCCFPLFIRFSDCWIICWCPSCLLCRKVHIMVASRPSWTHVPLDVALPAYLGPFVQREWSTEISSRQACTLQVYCIPQSKSKLRPQAHHLAKPSIAPPNSRLASFWARVFALNWEPLPKFKWQDGALHTDPHRGSLLHASLSFASYHVVSLCSHTTRYQTVPLSNFVFLVWPEMHAVAYSQQRLRACSCFSPAQSNHVRPSWPRASHSWPHLNQKPHPSISDLYQDRRELHFQFGAWTCWEGYAWPNDFDQPLVWFSQNILF